MHVGESTHPGFAALSDPLSQAIKKVAAFFCASNTQKLNPLGKINVIFLKAISPAHCNVRSLRSSEIYITGKIQIALKYLTIIMFYSDR